MCPGVYAIGYRRSGCDSKVNGYMDQGKSSNLRLVAVGLVAPVSPAVPFNGRGPWPVTGGQFLAWSHGYSGSRGPDLGCSTTDCGPVVGRELRALNVHKQTSSVSQPRPFRMGRWKTSPCFPSNLGFAGIGGETEGGAHHPLLFG